MSLIRFIAGFIFALMAGYCLVMAINAMFALDDFRSTDSAPKVESNSTTNKQR